MTTLVLSISIVILGLFTIWRITLPAITARQTEREQKQHEARMEADKLAHRQFLEVRQLDTPSSPAELATRKAEAEAQTAKYNAQAAEARERESRRYSRR